MDVLSDLLRVVHLSGAVFLQAEFAAPWSLSSPEPSALSTLVFPRSRHLVLFHCVASGECWVDAEQQRTLLQRDDVIVFPFADPHVMGTGDSATVSCLTSLFPGPPPWPTPLKLSYGGGGAITTLLCGFLHLDRGFFNPLLSSLPKVMIVRPDDSASGRLLRTSTEFLRAEVAAATPGAATVLGRLTELLFLEVLRQHMRQLAPNQLGWLSALRHPQIGQALQLLHDTPARGWTVEELARQVAMSRSGFAAKFGELVGEGPVQYLTRWRFQLACQLLRDTDHGMARIAEAVGYASESAFSRAFKRELGTAPADFRVEFAAN